MPKDRTPLQTIADKYNVGGYRRHVILCAGPKCCSDKEGIAAWKALKEAIKREGLSEGENACFRTHADCLRICAEGPIVVVYPEGTWYSGMTAERVERLVREHLIGGRPVEEWVFARNPLPVDS